MTTCNMIIEDERDLSAPIVEPRGVTTPAVEMTNNENSNFQDFLRRYRKIKDADAHLELRNKFIEHLWKEYIYSED
ncbi:hypothetical protein ACS0TY_007166 [Phlomoides rotata]